MQVGQVLRLATAPGSVALGARAIAVGILSNTLLKLGLALVLVWVGIKMIVSHWWHFPTVASLGVIVAIVAEMRQAGTPQPGLGRILKVRANLQRLWIED